MAERADEDMQGEEDMTRQFGLPSANGHMTIIGDHEANDQRVQSLLLPFASEESATIDDQIGDDQQKTQV
jgi:hypothetical protein